MGEKLPLELKAQVCSVIIDTGFIGSAEDYVRQFYGKLFEELTVCEAEMIIRILGSKPGCLAEEKEEKHGNTGQEMQDL